MSDDVRSNTIIKIFFIIIIIFNITIKVDIFIFIFSKYIINIFNYIYIKKEKTN